MDKETRNAIETATQKIRHLLEDDFREQLDGLFDVRIDGRVASEPGQHLTESQRRVRRKIVAAIDHKRSGGMKPDESVKDYLRDAAFTVLNRFVALKMLEARELVQPCVSQGEASSGFDEFCRLAPGARTPDGSGYRLYLECLFDELSTEVKVLFDRRDVASALWPRRAPFDAMLEILNAQGLASVWGEDETIGWVYQYFNGQNERRAMREASQAPRNSRELAVRNQFFTPRYVVQFLTDNTLGRIWYEMRDGKTTLAKTCEYMVRQPDETWAPRAIKDPRDLRILDPACGSGHFLLYTFDLLVTIYLEAWSDSHSPTSEATGHTLADDYPDIAALKLALPGLILAHNLHGVDIDARCAQIAQLALWMRAQRAFREFGLNRAQRPIIKRSNIVIAEPMPGERDMREEFLRELREDRLEALLRRALNIPRDRPVHVNKAMADSLAMLVETVWDEMALAGDMGVLLKIDRTLARGIEQAKSRWEGDMPLFPISKFGFYEEGTRFAGAATVHSNSDISLDFWSRVERLVLQALKEYSEETRDANVQRRKLFSDDAAHGFALVDLASKYFDVVLMNPPFGSGSLKAKLSIENAYPQSKNDLYSVFVERGIDFLVERGRLGAITSRTGLFLSSFSMWRRDVILELAPPRIVADLGYNVMDSALVEAAAYCLERESEATDSDAVFFRLTDVIDKAIGLKGLSSIATAATESRYIRVKPSEFRALPGVPFAYWVSDGIRAVFQNMAPFEATGRAARAGLQTSDDFRFVRAWWEVDSELVGSRWFPFAKGGRYAPYYDDINTVIRWERDGTELKAWASSLYDESHWSRILKNTEFYFREGLTWPRRGAEFSVQQLPRGTIFSDGKMGAFADGRQLFIFLALFNSVVGRALIRAQSDAVRIQFQCGLIQRFPVPEIDPVSAQTLEDAAKQAWSACRSLDAKNETSHAFLGPALIQAEERDNEKSFSKWLELLESKNDEIVCLQNIIDDVCLRLYNINSSELLEASTPHIEALAAETDGGSGRASDAFVDEVPEILKSDFGALVYDTLSWAVGVAFGRFLIAPPIGLIAPKNTSPFDPLPTRSPGMLPDGALPFMPTSGVFVDDPGHPDDLAARVTAVFERISDTPPAPDYLRRTLARDFFSAHVRMYSKSRRKAPIYWQLSTPSAKYSVWIYILNFRKDTLLRVQNDYVARKLVHEQRQLDDLVAEFGLSPTVAQSRAIEAQQEFLEELLAMLADVQRVEPLWDPDLDDGVIINFALLWRLVPQNRSWQKELRTTWKSLVAGEYDWAHLAMRLWPERVVPKCAMDRSLAIAHDLEDAFWFEGSDGKWQARPTPSRSVTELISERTSVAVKAALASLMEAPEPATGGRAKRGRKAA